jgi:hypothetical protein
MENQAFFAYILIRYPKELTTLGTSASRAMVYQQSYSPVQWIDSETTYGRRCGGPRARRNRRAAAGQFLIPLASDQSLSAQQ